MDQAILRWENKLCLWTIWIISRQSIAAILTRPELKQIDFCFNNYDSNIDQKLLKNYTLEQITFKFYFLPNIMYLEFSNV